MSEKDKLLKKDKLIASFDIGIKNLAVCVLNQDRDILFWKVINILGDSKIEYCDVCNKKATFYLESNTLQVDTQESEQDSDKTPAVEGHWYCRTHDPKKKERTQAEIKKAKAAIDGKKVKSCTTKELQLKLVQAMDTVQEEYSLLDVDEVVIELQPRFNPKMKQLSHTLYAWFIIYGINSDEYTLKDVKFIAAKNKLKLASKLYDGPAIECKLKSKYARTKYFGMVYTKYILREHPEHLETLTKYSKADDLCDCYLQGLWYLDK